MAGYITYLIVVAVPCYLLALLTPWLAYTWIALLVVASVYRLTQNPDDEKERKAFWWMAVPCYVFAILMVALWFHR